MAKDPAINWYFDNWGGGTKTMSRFLKGCYMDLLDAQFQSGHLSLEEIKHVLAADFSAWQTLQKKFKQDVRGNYFNERLDHEINKRLNNSQKQSEKVKKRWELYHGINNGITTDIPNNEIGIETGIGIENVLQKPKKEEVERVFIQQGGTKEMADAFFNRYEAVEWKIRGTPVKNFTPLIGNFIKNWKENKNGHANNPSGNQSNRDKQADASARLIQKLKTVAGAGSEGFNG